MHYSKSLSRYVSMLLFSSLMFLFASRVHAASTDTIRIPVICYHHVNNVMNNFITTSTSAFDAQMRYLKDNGYTSIVSSEIAQVIASPQGKKPVIISFDDNNRSIYTEAFPIMKKYGFKGVMFIISSKCVQTTTSKSLAAPITVPELKEMHDAGWEMGSHTVNHPYLHRCSREKIEKELAESKARIEKQCTASVISLAYPYGSFNDDVLDIAKKYYRYGYTILDGNNQYITSPYTLQRHMILRSTTLHTFARVLESNDLTMDLSVVLTSSTSCTVTIRIPLQYDAASLYIDFNYKQQHHYTTHPDGKITFSAPCRHALNYCTVMAKDAQGTNYSITRFILVDKKKGTARVF